MRERGRRFVAAWVAGSLATVGLVPAYIAVITVVLLLGFAGGTQVSGVPVVSAEGRFAAAVLGPALGLLVWAVVGLVAARFTGAEQANPVLYADLVSQVAGLRSRIAASCPIADLPSALEGGPAAACQEARAHCEVLEVQLGLVEGGPRAAGGPSWTTGAGYVGTLRRVHRAEEALLSVSPVPTVVAEALYDRSRLSGSTIGNRGELLTASAVALKALDGGSAAYVGPGPVLLDETPLDATAGREVIRRIRLAINEFRDDRSAELVRLRRRLNQSLLFTGMTGVVGLLLAVLAAVPVVTILGAVTYYLIGALVGLLQRIHGELELERSVEDFGLSTARLLLAPLVSGLAAVAGVTLVSVVSGRPFGLYLVEPGALPAGSLFDVYNVLKYPFGLVVAAAFGLAPGVLLRRLKTVGDSLKTDLQSSEAASPSGGR
jgi:hypothetical protein